MSDEEDDPFNQGDEEMDAPRCDDKNELPKAQYDVGYGKTAVHTRFTRGHKRGGRPPGSKNTRTLMVEAWNEKHPVQGRRARISTKVIATRRLAKKAAEGDLKAFEKFERAEAEHAANSTGRPAGSRFDEPADALTMTDIIQRIRNMAIEEPTPGSEHKCLADRDDKPADVNGGGNGNSPGDDH